MTRKKIGIIGMGNVGASIAYTLTCESLFSEMVLIDVNTEKAHGEALDLRHCLPFIEPMKIYDGNYNDLRDAFITVIAAGVNQKEGETRLELVRKNTKIIESITKEISRVNKDCIILVVTNPVDILTYTALKASGFDKTKVIGSGTVLDSARLKYLLGEKLKVDSRNVHSFIIGEHGDSELAVWSSANVSGINLNEYPDIEKYKGEFGSVYEYVKNSAYEIIKCKGATYYAIAQSTARIIRAIVNNQNAVLPVSTFVEDHYGLDGLCISVPAVIGESGVIKVLDISLDENEKENLKKSACALKAIINETEYQSV